MEAQIVTITTPSFEVQVNDAFAPFEAQFKEWQDKAKMITVTDVSHKDGMQQAREARLALRGVRTSVDKKRKELKDDSLKTGRLIDSIGNRIIDAIESIEKDLQEKEDFEKNLMAAQYRALKADRVALLQPWTDQDAKLMPLADMPADSFEMMLVGYKEAFQQKQDLARQAEEQRQARAKAEAEELERTRAENEQLKRESEERAREEKDKKVAADRAAAIERSKAEAKLKQERDAREKLEKELRELSEKEEADRKAKAAADRKAKRAPDKVKLLAFAERLELQNCEHLKDDDAQMILANAIGLMAKVTKYIRDNAEKL